MKTAIIIGFVVISSFLTLLNASIDSAEFVTPIRIDDTGEGCLSIGDWDQSNRTCYLTEDLTFGIQIDSDNITLDGQGYIITGTGVGYGVYLEKRTGVIIKNLEVKRFSTGISLVRSSNNTLIDNTVSWNTPNGIELFESHGNTINGNLAENNNGHGISLDKSFGNTITGNTTLLNEASGVQIDDESSNNTVIGNTVSSKYGITLSGSSTNNTVTNNTVIQNTYVGIGLSFSANNNIISYNRVYNNLSGERTAGILISYSSYNNQIYNNNLSENSIGIWISNSGDNQIYNNNFMENIEQAYVSGESTNNFFNLGLPEGGNYWSDWTSPDENYDGFVDNPYLLDGIRDDYPWVNQDGWMDTTPPLIYASSPQLQAYKHSDMLTVSYSASDPSGLSDGSPTAKIDNTHEVANEQIIDLLLLSLGWHTFTVNACDIADNCGNVTVSFNVTATIESLISTTNYFAKNGGIDEDNVWKSLMKKLNEAKESMSHEKLNVTRNKLSDFLDQVNAQIGKHITIDAASLLIKDAVYVLCSL